MNVGISNWLASGRDYETGVALYQQHGSSGLIKRLLTSSCTSYTRDVLAKELSKLVVTAPTPPSRTRSPDLARPVASTLPDMLVELRQARRPLLSEREYLHARLELLSEVERGEAALCILAIGDELQKSYEAEAHYEKYGTLPAAVPAATPALELATLTDRSEIRRLLALARAQRSKLKGRADRVDDYTLVVANIELLESKLSQ